MQPVAAERLEGLDSFPPLSPYLFTKPFPPGDTRKLISSQSYSEAHKSQISEIRLLGIHRYSFKKLENKGLENST